MLLNDRNIYSLAFKGSSLNDVKGQGFFDDSIKALILKRMIMKGRGDKFRDVIYGRPLIRHVLYANYNY